VRSTRNTGTHHDDRGHERQHDLESHLVPSSPRSGR
jgi:hypothetical protein